MRRAVLYASAFCLMWLGIQLYREQNPPIASYGCGVEFYLTPEEVMIFTSTARIMPLDDNFSSIYFTEFTRSPDCRYLGARVGQSSDARDLIIWDLPKRQRHTLNVGIQNPLYAEWLTDEGFLLVYFANEVYLWDLNTDIHTRVYPPV